MEEIQDIQHNEVDKTNTNCPNTEENPVSDASTETREGNEAPQQEISQEEQLRLDLEKLKDQHLRTVAEFDNYRKRTLKEKSELIKNGGEKVLVELLPILDDFELAIKHSDDTNEDDPVRQGILLIYNKLIEFVRKQGVHAIETEGAAFDDQYHEAIALIPAPTPDLKGKVIDCVQRGYIMGEKVIRYARVVVGE